MALKCNSKFSQLNERVKDLERGMEDVRGCIGNHLEQHHAEDWLRTEEESNIYERLDILEERIEELHEWMVFHVRNERGETVQSTERSPLDVWREKKC